MKTGFNIIQAGEIIDTIIGYDFDAEYQVNYNKDLLPEFDCHFEETKKVSYEVYEKLDTDRELIEDIVKLSHKFKDTSFLYNHTDSDLVVWIEDDNFDNVELFKIDDIAVHDANETSIYLRSGDNHTTLNNIRCYEQLTKIKDFFQREIELL